MRVQISFVLLGFQILNCHGGASNSRLNFFDIDLLRSIAENKKGNVVVSPASIKSTLAMILEGATGPTAEEIKRALRVSPVKHDFREELYVYLRALEANTTDVLLHNANALFVSKKLKLNKDYERVVQRLYLAEVGKLDFENSKASADTINSWANAKTQGLIPTIIEEAHVSPATEMLLANALFFKAPWKNAFEPKWTHSDCFYVDGVCRDVAMMDLQAEVNYAFVDDLRAHALELPYKGDRYSMILLVPQDRDSGMALLRDLPYIGLPQISDMMHPAEVVLSMPKFTVDYKENMVAALKNMRINALFSKEANISGILEAGESSYLNSIYHSVHMKVDEEGTVASAATIGMVVPLINDMVQLRIDRPFLFFIRDNKLGLILFEGKIEEPTFYEEAQSQGPVKNTPASSPAINSQPQPSPFAPQQSVFKNVPSNVPTQSNDGSRQTFNNAPNYPNLNQASYNQVSNNPSHITPSSFSYPGPSQTNFELVFPSRSNINQEGQKPLNQSTNVPNLNQSGQSQTTSNSVSHPPVESTTSPYQSSQSQTVPSSNPSTESVERKSKESGISSWFKKIGNLF